MRRATIMGACFPPVTPAMCSLSRTLGRKKKENPLAIITPLPPPPRHSSARRGWVNIKKSQQISGEISVGSPRERIASDRRLRTPRRRLVRKSIRFVHALSWVLLVSTVRAGPRGALETSVPLAGGVRDPAAPVLGFLACKLVKSSWAFLPHFMVVAHRKKENEMKPSRR